MDEWVSVLALGGLAGVTIPAAGLLAAREDFHADWLEREGRHYVIAFGGGVLIAAVALVLVPHGIDVLPAGLAALSLAAGGGSFALLDAWMARHGSGGQLLALLADFVPEALALGALMGTGRGQALLLAGLIALQNAPEGFNAFREIRARRAPPRQSLLGAFTALVAVGPVAAWLGRYALAGHTWVLGSVMLFASGGILYVTFQDIAPQARLQRHWGPPLGAVAGFMLGMLGHMLTGG
jgi:ZIP family zinc transporter